MCVKDSVCWLRGCYWLKSFRESHVTAEWEEGALGGHESPTQASSLLLFLLVMAEEGRGGPSIFSIPFDNEVNPV